MNGDLTTLANVKAWLGLGTASVKDAGQADAILSRLITAASAFVQNYVQRPTFATRTVTERYDTGGNDFMLLRQWPVQSVSSIDIMGRSITTQGSYNPFTPGYILETSAGATGAQQITLIGYRFPAARQATQVTYTCGYIVPAEAVQVPTAGPFTVQTQATWLEDEGVTIGGAALTLVAGVPGPGQYSVVAGLYTFNAAQAGAQASLAYSYVPPDVEDAVINLVGERYKAKDRIGKNSESQNGQVTLSYTRQDMSPWIATALEPYRRTTPN